MLTALLSVYDKTGVAQFAKELAELDYDIIASEGTAKELIKAGIPVRYVSELVGGGPMLDHRVVTLSREVHAGLLARDIKEDRQKLESEGIPWIDLVCVELYPLQEEIDNPNSTRESVIEMTDIGGPAMLRSAAKGRRIVICDRLDREIVLLWLRAGKPEQDTFITNLTAKAEAVVAEYCLASARYHSQNTYDGFVGGKVRQCLCYGENAYQNPAGLYSNKITKPSSNDSLDLANFSLVAGTLPSYINFCDVDRMIQTVTHISAVFTANKRRMPFIAVGCKHGNACGAAIGDDYLTVILNMIRGSTRAIFGGMVMVNFPVNQSVAEKLVFYLMSEGKRRLLDGVCAPSFSKEAIAILKRKGDRCRLFSNSSLTFLSLDKAPRFRYVRGGFLRQSNYTFVLDLNAPELEKIGQATIQQEDDLLLAWAIGSTSNSNTITLVRDNYLIANAVGQQDRVGACALAVERAREAGHETEGAVAYSDSFFPFVDGPEVLAEAGIKVVLASSGSIRDEEVKRFCKEKGIVLYLIPDKIGRGFFGH